MWNVLFQNIDFNTYAYEMSFTHFLCLYFLFIILRRLVHRRNARVILRISVWRYSKARMRDADFKLLNHKNTHISIFYAATSSVTPFFIL